MTAAPALEDELESTLLLLGRKERLLLDTLQELKAAAKNAVRVGRLDVADATMTKYERLRDGLDALEIEIMKVERRLYGMRILKR